MRVLAHLEPAQVWAHFEALCNIPHGSGNTKAISDYCASVADTLGLAWEQDEANNIIIRKPASAGYETHPAVILQAHLDMVCEKDADVDFDFATDSLRLQVKGDWISAQGTTLGGDDGSGVALALALLEDDTLCHPPLEVVFTTDEETGMWGALALDGTRLTGRRMINLDCGQEGCFTLGCAGGAKARLSLPLDYAANDLPCFEIVLHGLKGGHSGNDIHTGRLNANKLLGDLLSRLPEGWRLVQATGGEKDNVIAYRCVATVACPEVPAAVVETFLQENRVDTDPDLAVTISPTALAPIAATAACSAAAASLLNALPYGVQAMHPKLEGLVETSLNLGVLETANNHLQLTLSVRSAEKDKKLALLRRLEAIITAVGGAYSDDSHYPAWEYQENSPLQQIVLGTYRQFTGKEPLLAVTHAGLECGLFSEKLPGLDTVSMGPDQEHIHSSRERLSISSMGRTFAFLKEVLKEL